MMYAIIRFDHLTQKQADAINESKTGTIKDSELIEMNALARIELSKGNKRLNATLIAATDQYVQNELNVRINTYLDPVK